MTLAISGCIIIDLENPCNDILFIDPSVVKFILCNLYKIIEKSKAYQKLL